MSSLIMGRQRRGKNELSTLVDPATIVGPDQLFPLGYELAVPAGATNGNGPQTWVYIQASLPVFETNIPQYIVVSRASLPLFVVDYSGSAEQINVPIGATQSAIPNGEFGFVLRKGVGTLTLEPGVSIAFNESIIMAADGEVTTHAGVVAAETGFGFAIANTPSTGLPVEFSAYVNFLG